MCRKQGDANRDPLDKTNSNPLRACRSGLSVLAANCGNAVRAGVTKRGVDMKLWRLLAVLLLIGGVSTLSACGDSNFDERTGGGVAFTPTPVPPPPGVVCGNGEIDPGEECDPNAAATCTGAEECVCCLCLEPGEELGTREFTFVKPPSGIRTSVLGGTDATQGLEILPGPLVMRAGRPDPDLPDEEACTASITVEEDVLIGFRQPIGFACTKIFAPGVGTIDCDGGSPFNVDYTADSNGAGPESEPVIRTGLGRCCTSEDATDCSAEPFEVCDPNADPPECGAEFPVCSIVGSGPGAATMRFPTSLTVILSVNNTLDDCNCLANVTTAQEAVEQCPGFAVAQVADEVTVSPAVLTTQIAHNIVTNPAQGGPPQEISRIGENLSCASWTETDSEGVFMFPLAGFDLPVVQDAANMLVLGDQLVEDE